MATASTISGRKLHLGLFIYPGGHHIAGWRHPTTPADGLAALDYYRTAAQLAERGKFDLFFVGDTLAAREKDGKFFGRQAISNLDPVSLVSVLSAVTERLGLVATLSTTYHEPFNIAAKFASLDHLSGGRAGWNVVTTWDDAAAFNFSQNRHPERPKRYQRATEFIDIVTGLWDGWDEEALVADWAGGRFVDPARIHALDHQGEYLRVRGSLRLPRPVQGWPVLVQAGGSPAGRDFAARIGEAIFTAQGKLEPAKAFRAELHEAVGRYGRSPESVKILPGLSPLIGSTEAEAKAKQEELDELVHPVVGVWMLSEALQFRLYDYADTDPLPVARIRAEGAPQTANGESMLQTAEREKLTLRDCARRIARSRAHGSFVGTPQQLIDHMASWFEVGACDGFNIMPPYFPNQLALFVDEVVPLLQRRGLFRQDYEGTTLRDHLGLPVPPRRRAMPRSVAAE